MMKDIGKLILNPKHIEFQILADSFGNVINLGEGMFYPKKKSKNDRRITLYFLTDALREEMGQVAIKAAKACNYENAGTVEFIVDQEETIIL